MAVRCWSFMGLTMVKVPAGQGNRGVSVHTRLPARQYGNLKEGQEVFGSHLAGRLIDRKLKLEKPSFAGGPLHDKGGGEVSVAREAIEDDDLVGARL